MAFNNNNNTSAAIPHKPTVGEKISGTVESLVGKVTNNPVKVAEGEAKKTGEPLHGAAAGAHQATHNSNLTGNNHGHSSTGTGLTGNHDHSTGLTGNHGNTGAGLTGNHGNTGAGLTGNHGHNAGQPTFGDRVTGQKDQVVGRATGDHVQYAEGQARAGEYGSANTGLAGNHGHAHDHSHSHGTGLTGNHDQTALGNHGHTGTHTGAGVGSHQQHGNPGYEHGKPTIGDKLSGATESLVGKATSNPAKVAEGEAKRTGDFQHAQAAAANTGTDAYGNHQTGPLAGSHGAHGAPGAHSTTGGAYGNDNINTGNRY